MKLSMPELLLVEKEGPITIITINRPNKLNAFNPQVIKELNTVLDQVENDPAVKVMIITGAGEKAFVVGNDLEQLAKLDTISVYEQMLLGQKLFLRIHEFEKPVIAMVNGYALGGGFELALSCDMIVASQNAKFGFPEINLNTLPGWGGTQLATKKLGLNRTKEMVLTGEHYSAATCSEFGIINRMVPEDQLKMVAMDLATKLASKEAFSLKIAKNAVNRGSELDLATGFQFEAQAYAVNFSGPHAQRGFNDFFDRHRKDKSSREN